MPPAFEPQRICARVQNTHPPPKSLILSLGLRHNWSPKFGDGLSYTSFATALDAPRGAARVSKETLEATMAVAMEHEAPELAMASITVTNTGAVAADHTALLFAVPPTAGVDGAPLKTLVGFERIAALAPGASATVAVPLSAYSFSYAALDGTRISIAGDWKLIAGEASTTFTVL